MKAERITKEALKAKIEQGEPVTILDVRNPFDFENSDVKLPGALHIPVADLEARAGEFDPDREVVAYCT